MKLQKRSMDFDKMIVEAIKEGFSFFAWQSVGGYVEKCEMKVKALRKDVNEIELWICNGQVNKMELIFTGSRTLNIYVPELSVSFSAEIKLVTEDRKVKLHTPLEYSFFERRKHERIHPIKPCTVSFVHNKAIIKKAIYDFSLGGVAIIIPKSAKMFIKKGKVFEMLILDFGYHKIKVQAECVNSIIIDRFKVKNLPYGGFKLVFRFTEVSIKDKAFIADFVTNEILMEQVHKEAN